MQRRIYRLYGELRAIERGLENRDIAEQDKRDLDSQLDHLEEKAHDLAVTLSYVGMLYRLREQIALVRERVGNPKGQPNELNYHILPGPDPLYHLSLISVSKFVFLT